MKFKEVQIIVISLFIILIFSSNCEKITQRKIPVTTSSEKALDYFIQGREYYENLRIKESISYFKKAIEEDPNFALAYYYLSSAYRFTGSSTGFYQNLEKAVSLIDKYLAFAHPHINDTDDFYSNLKKAVSLTDKVSEGEKYLILALNAGVEGNTEKEEEYYKKLTELYPGDKRAHQHMAQFYFSAEKYYQCIEAARKCIEIDSSYAPAYNLLGYSYKNTGQYRKAKKALEKYTKLIPDEANPYDSLAELLMQMGRFKESIEIYRKSLEKNPKFYYSYHGLGVNYILMDKWDKAREIYKEFLELAPNDVHRREALFYIMCTYIDQGHYNKALESLKKRYDISAENNDCTEMYRDLAMKIDILLEAGMPDSAKKINVKAVEILKGSSVNEIVKEEAKRSLLYNNARVEIERGNLARADSFINKFHREAEEDNNTRAVRISHRIMGILAYHRENFEEALKYINKADSLNPLTIYWKGRIYRAIGNRKQAETSFSRVANFNEINYNYWFVRNKAKKRLKEMQGQ